MKTKKIIKIGMLILIVFSTFLACKKKIDDQKIENQNKPPEVTTLAISDYDSIQKTVQLNGRLVSIGSSPVTKQGFCYALKSNTSLMDSVLIINSGIGAYSSTLNKLIVGATYYIKAFAQNSTGVAYGAEVVFNVNDKTPFANTGLASLITDSTAKVEGDCSLNLGSNIKERGFLWGLAITVSFSKSNKKTAGNLTGDGSGNFSAVISGLQGGTKYYYRAYAINSRDTGYGLVREFTTNTLSPMVISPTISLGGPNNFTNEYHFFGVSDNFQSYRSGSTGLDLARNHSEVIDFVYTYSSSGAVGNALYSPDFDFSSGGWSIEIATWATKNKTLYKGTSVTSSEFDAYDVSQFLTAINAINFSSGSFDKMPNMFNNQVFAFKRSNGKRGFIKVVSTTTSPTGIIKFLLKAEQ
ncbi:MAG: hypothetical protein Q8M15_14645 [Bacteroidota bacterium]|nr:hypothetical protein [Bacteroidota bacterium]